MTLSRHRKLIREAPRSGAIRFGAAIASLLLAFMPHADAQQDPTPAAAGTAGVTLEQVVVTAQKTSENLRDVPISVSVVGAAQLSQHHVEDTEDLTRMVPDFSFNSNGNPGSDSLEIRGISSSAGASTVGIYLDDVSITARSRGNYNVSQPEPYMLDISQVEVLRGPQGTLYGASAEGGLIKFRTNPVSLTEVDGSTNAWLSDTERGGANYNVNGTVNIPIVSGVLGVRVGAASSYDSGYIDRFSQVTGGLLGKDVNDQRVSVARMSVEARPVQGLVIKPAFFYQDLSYNSSNTVALGLGTDNTNTLVSDGGSDTMILPSLTMEYNIGSFTVTSVSADYTRRAPFIFDGTEFNSVYIGQCMLDGLCGSPPVTDLHGNLSGSVIDELPGPAVDEYWERQVSQELRVASRPYTGSGLPFAGVAGLYYVDSTSRSDDAEYITNFTDTFIANYGVPTLDALFGGPIPNNVIYDATKRFYEKQYSAFGDLSYYPTPALRLSVGTRYLSAHQSFVRSAYGFFNGGPSQDAETSTDHSMTPKASVNYTVTPRTSVYATASKGFRLGAPNPPVPAEFCANDLAALGMTKAPNAYVHEDLWNYEAGVKSRPRDWAAINASGFFINWDGLQQYFILPVCGYSLTTNVGKARSYGAELEFTVRPVSSLTIELSGGYTHATLTQAIPSLGIRSGTAVEGVPRWTASGALGYDRPLSADVDGFAQFNYTYTGPSHGAVVVTDADYNRPAYGLAGASLGVARLGWSVELYAKNLFDDRKVIQTPDHATLPVGFTLRPRTVGIAVSGKF